MTNKINTDCLNCGHSEKAHPGFLCRAIIDVSTRNDKDEYEWRDTECRCPGYRPKLLDFTS